MSKSAASRRKSSADGGGGGASNASNAEPEPATMAAAKALVGRVVDKVFRDDAFGKFRPFRGEVADVMASARRADGSTDPRFYYYVRYEDGDSEHMPWSELVAVLLPPDAEDAARAAAKGNTNNKGKQARGSVKSEGEPAAAKPAAAGKKRRGSTAGGPAAADGEATADPADANEDGAAAAAAAANTTATPAKRARKTAGTATATDDNAGDAPAAAAPAAAEGDATTLSAGGAVAGEDDDGGEGAIAGIDSRVRARGLPGHLRRVRLRNFMCHANFEMEFGAHVNVVSGTNGSGKSAVLQAVQACLGASAKVTGRATSMGDFVRTGSDEALVSVELWNGGEDGYDRARLGDSVTIERRIAAGTGSSQWRVLDHRGRVVATGPAAKKRVIDPMLDHLSVNAANPMAAMTQDTARTFLSSGATGPQRRFELFMEATMLALFKTNLDAARSYASQMASRVEEVLRDHKERVDRMRDAERKLALLDEAKEAAANRGPLERAAAWALAAEGQAQVRALRTYVDKVLPGKIKALKDGRRRGLEETDELHAELRELKDKQAKATRLAERFAQAEAKQSKQLKDAKADVTQVEEDLRLARKALREAEADLKRHRQATAEATAGQRAALAPQLASQEEGREAAQQRLAEATADREAKERALAAARERLQQLRDDMRSARLSATTAAGMRADTDVALEQARTDGNNSLAPYRTRRLRARIDEIQASGRSPFKHPPIGPLGAHVAASDPVWHRALTATTGHALDHWIVGCAEDADVLQRLAREVSDAYMRLPPGQRDAIMPPQRVLQVYVRSYGAARYAIPPQSRPAEPYSCALDALAVSHPTHADVIFNMLVDTFSLERVALADDRAAADRAVLEGKAGPVCASAVDKAGRVLQRHGTSVTSAREYVFTKSMSRMRVVKRGAEQTIAALQDQQKEAARLVEQAERRAAELEKEVRAAEADADALEAAFREARAQQMRFTRALERQVAEIQDTQRVMDLGPEDDDDDDDADGDDRRGGAGTAANAAARTGNSLSKAVDDRRSRVQRLERDLAAARDAIARADAAMDAALTNLRSEGGLMPDEIEALVEKITETDGKRKQIGAHLDKMTAQAALLEKEAKDLAPVADAAERELLPPLLKAARAVCDDAQGVIDLVRAKEICLDAARRRIDADTRKSVQRLTPEQKDARALEESAVDFGSAWALEHLDALDRRLREAETDAGGSREETLHKRDMLKHEVRRQAAIVRNLRTTNEAVQAQVTRRARAYDALFASVEQTVRHKFELFMARRHHTGTIRITHGGGSSNEGPGLQILVVPNGARAAGGGGAGGRTAQAARDLRQLSGGERSFTTVAFMLALGEWTESPFRAADELDVFMDAVNRRVAMEAVLEFAAERDHLQMVLLTPQDLQAVEDAKVSLARRRARRARQARRQQQLEEEAERGGGGRGRGRAAPQPEEEDDDLDEAEEAAAALPEGFVRVLKMPSARDAGGVRRRQAAAVAAGGE